MPGCKATNRSSTATRGNKETLLDYCLECLVFYTLHLLPLQNKIESFMCVVRFASLTRGRVVVVITEAVVRPVEHDSRYSH